MTDHYDHENAGEWLDRETAKNAEENTKRLVRELNKTTDHYDHEKAKRYKAIEEILLTGLYVEVCQLEKLPVSSRGHNLGGIFAIAKRIKEHREQEEQG